MSACATPEDVIYAGQRVPLHCRFTVDGAPVDPTTVTLKLRVNGGAATTYNYPAGLSQVETGHYLREHEADPAGVWEYAWESTGNCDAVTRGQFTVRATGF